MAVRPDLYVKCARGLCGRLRKTGSRFPWVGTGGDLIQFGTARRSPLPSPLDRRTRITNGPEGFPNARNAVSSPYKRCACVFRFAEKVAKSALRRVF